MVGAGMYGFKNGDPLNILTPFDSVGNKCGYDNTGIAGTDGQDFTEYPFKYFTSLTPTGNLSLLTMYYAVCVKECPVMM